MDALKYAIRKLTPDDADAFQALRLRGLLECPSAFSSSYAEEVDTPIPVVAGRLASRASAAVWGCFSRAQLAGIVGVQREQQAQLSHKAALWGMYVEPAHRRRGVGRLLVTSALNYAKEELRVRSVHLGVNTLNEAALTLYRASGFEIYGTERGFLQVAGVLHDEHLMVRIL